jgi:GH24 family phage-related lysozyme (muramidase)
MRDADLLVAAILIGGAYIMLRRNNPQPGTFSPNAPGAVDRYSSDIIPLTVDQAGVDFIEQEEGFSGTPYPDAGGMDIGYGHVLKSGENWSSITRAQAQTLLSNDLVPIQNVIAQYVTVPLDQNQYDALADLIYNVGINAFENSTLLKMLNAGNYAGAANQFSAWVNSNGKVNSALQARRSQDQNLFQS